MKPQYVTETADILIVYAGGNMMKMSVTMMMMTMIVMTADDKDAEELAVTVHQAMHAIITKYVFRSTVAQD